MGFNPKSGQHVAVTRNRTRVGSFDWEAACEAEGSDGDATKVAFVMEPLWPRALAHLCDPLPAAAGASLLPSALDRVEGTAGKGALDAAVLAH